MYSDPRSAYYNYLTKNAAQQPIGQNADGSYIYPGDVPPQQPRVPNVGETVAREAVNQGINQGVNQAIDYGASIFGSGAGAEAGASAGAGAGTGAGAALMPVLGPLAVGAIGAYTAHQAYNAYNAGRNKGAMGGLKEGIRQAGPLNFVPLLGQAAWMAGLAGGALGGKKHKDQYRRDDMRRGLQESGMIDNSYNLTLADGNKYDIGKDGSVKNYNVDFSRPGMGDIVGAVNPLAELYAQGDAKARSDLAGYLANAAASSGDPMENARSFFTQTGYDRNKAWEDIDKLVKAEKISSETGDAYKAGIDKLYGIGQPKDKKK